MPNWYTINHPTTLHTHNETVTHCCSPMAICAAGCILQAKLPSLDTQPPPGSPRLTILSASSVRTLVHCVVKYSRPPDLKSSSNVSLPFAWITGPATDPSFFYETEIEIWEKQPKSQILHHIKSSPQDFSPVHLDLENDLIQLQVLADPVIIALSIWFWTQKVCT